MKGRGLSSFSSTEEKQPGPSKEGVWGRGERNSPQVLSLVLASPVSTGPPAG